MNHGEGSSPHAADPAGAPADRPEHPARLPAAMDRGPENSCAQCGRSIPHGQEVATQTRVFCRTCYDKLHAVVSEHLRRQSEDIHYPGAITGGVLGGLVGALIWWGFTTLTHISFGLVAIVIGFAVGTGVVRFSGGKRAAPLQVISVAIAVSSYGLASYWVNRTFLLRAWAERELSLTLPLLPDPSLLLKVVKANFNMMDLVFLGILVYEAWRIPKPIALR